VLPPLHFAGVVALFAAVSCSVGDVDYTGKSCAAAPCPAGWSCTADAVCARGLVAADWTSMLSAVYRFEDPAAIGRDSSGHGNDLVATGDVSLSMEAAIEGAACAQFPFASTLSSASSAFDITPGGSFTTGGWFRTVRDQSQCLLQKVDSSISNGYYFDLYDVRPSDQVSGNCLTGLEFRVLNGDDGYCDRSLTCAYLNSDDPNLAGSCDPGAFAQVWLHLVARYDASAQDGPQLQVFVNGVPHHGIDGVPSSQPAQGGIGAVQASFKLGCATSDACAYTGEMDEIFYAARALSDSAVARIYVCGIDGRECTCASDGRSYVERGRPEADAGGPSLPPCGAPGP
jgi:hypothetical protein